PPPAATPTASPAASPGGPPPIDRVTPLPNPLPDIAARVNGREIPLKYAEIIARRLLEKGDKEKDRPWAYRQAVQQLITRELLLGEAMARRVTADDTKVDAAYNEARVSYKDEDAWTSFLADQGLTLDAFKSEIRTQLTVQALLDQEAARVPAAVSDQDASAFYQSNPGMFESGERRRASHILLRVPSGATAAQKVAVRARAQALLARLRKGEDFAKLAKEFSEDAGSAGKGGRLEPFGPGQMDPAFEKAVFALKPAERSDVVETPFGFHIILLFETLPSEHLAFEPTKEKIKQYILVNRRQQRIEALLATLHAKASIETYL
ncbi:MAG: peptidylprolyl isomerase, partial [Vicinamibacteria bacterium]